MPSVFHRKGLHGLAGYRIGGWARRAKIRVPACGDGGIRRIQAKHFVRMMLTRTGTSHLKSPLRW